MCLVPMAGPGHYVLNCGFKVTFPGNQGAIVKLKFEFIFIKFSSVLIPLLTPQINTSMCKPFKEAKFKAYFIKFWKF